MIPTRRDEEVGPELSPSAHKTVAYNAPRKFGHRPRYNERICVPNRASVGDSVGTFKAIKDFVENAPNLVGILAGVVVIVISAAILFSTIDLSYYYACSTASEAVIAARPDHWAADFKICSVYWNLPGENGEMAGATVSGEFVGPNRAGIGFKHQPYRVFMTSNRGILKVRSVYIEDTP
jgi:hypothetical protein